MSIIEKIKQSVEGATGLPFHYDTPQTLNQTLERATFPCAMLNILQAGAVTDANGIMRERLTIEVLFSSLSSLDFDGTEVERDEIDAMKRNAFKWVQSLFRSHDVRLISNNGSNRYYATDDMIFSAYGINVTIEEIEGVAPCYDEDI